MKIITMLVLNSIKVKFLVSWPGRCRKNRSNENLIGADQKTSGKIILKGKEVKNGWNTTKALKAGIGLLPEDRKTQGFMIFLTTMKI